MTGPGPAVPPPPPQSPPPAPPVGKAGTLADGEWHRMHPLTPLFKGGLALLVILGIVIANLRDRLIAWFVELFEPSAAEMTGSGYDPVGWVFSNNAALLVVIGVLVFIIVLIVIFWVLWRFHQFRVTGDHVEVRKGIVFRSHRRAPLDRVQGVNLTRPFPARLFGLVKLEVVGAGTDSNVDLEYLATAKAESVRADILRLASGTQRARRGGEASAPGAMPGTAPGTTGSASSRLASSVSDGVTGMIEGVDLADVEPESVVKIPTGRLVGAQLLSGVLWFIFFGAIFAVTLAITIPAILSDGSGPDATVGIIAIVLGMGIPLLIAVFAVTWGQISKSLRYSIAPTPNGVRITFGLFTTITETIPPGRIFGVEVTQSILWRPFGWWSIKINRMSGKSLSAQQSGTAQQFNIVLPVGTRADVERVLGLILPALPDDDKATLWDHGVIGPQAGDPFVRMPKRAWWRRPLSWKRHGFSVSDFSLMLRRGVLWRKLAIFPLARMQGLSVAQGPIDRVQQVGWMQAHSITGPIQGQIVGIDRTELLASYDDLTTRINAATGNDPGHRWATEQPPAVVGASAPVPPSASAGSGSAVPPPPAPDARSYGSVPPPPAPPAPRGGAVPPPPTGPSAPLPPLPPSGRAAQLPPPAVSSAVPDDAPAAPAAPLASADASEPAAPVAPPTSAGAPEPPAAPEPPVAPAEDDGSAPEEPREP